MPMIIPEHLEAYEIALIVWLAVLAVYGLQGLISVYLEGRELELEGGHQARASWGSLLLLLGLLAFQIFDAAEFVTSFLGGASSQTLAVYAALGFFGLAAMLVVYRRAFISDEAIAQEREDDVPW